MLFDLVPVSVQPPGDQVKTTSLRSKSLARLAWSTLTVIDVRPLP